MIHDTGHDRYENENGRNLRDVATTILNTTDRINRYRDRQQSQQARNQSLKSIDRDLDAIVDDIDPEPLEPEILGVESPQSPEAVYAELSQKTEGTTFEKDAAIAQQLMKEGADPSFVRAVLNSSEAVESLKNIQGLEDAESYLDVVSDESIRQDYIQENSEQLQEQRVLDKEMEL